MFEKITKKKLALMFIAGIVIPISFQMAGLPLVIVTPISLIISCMIDTVILYKVGKWIWTRTKIHN